MLWSRKRWRNFIIARTRNFIFYCGSFGFSYFSTNTVNFFFRFVLWTRSWRLFFFSFTILVTNCITNLFCWYIQDVVFSRTWSCSLSSIFMLCGNCNSRTIFSWSDVITKYFLKYSPGPGFSERIISLLSPSPILNKLRKTSNKGFMIFFDSHCKLQVPIYYSVQVYLLNKHEVTCFGWRYWPGRCIAKFIIHKF